MKIDKDALIKIYNSGKTQTEIAEIFNCVPQTISKIMKKYNIQTRKFGSWVKPKINISLGQLKGLYDIGKTQVEIAKIFNCGQQTISNLMKKYGIQIKRQDKYNIQREELIKLYNYDYKTQKEISEIFKCPDSTIEYKMKKYGIKGNHGFRVARRKSIILNDCQKEIIDGELLGDGFLTPCIINNRNVNSRFIYCTLQREYLEWLINELNILDFKDIAEFIQMRWKRNISFKSNTKANPALTAIHKRWYKLDLKRNNKYSFTKHIPRDLILTSLICRGWYIGDGSLCKTRKSITLATDSFIKKEQEQILLPQLNKLGFEARLYKHGINKMGEQQYIIYIPKRNVQKFLNYIGPCPVKCYEYKWGGK